MSKPIANGFRKAALSSSIAAALSLGGVQQAQADIYEFSFDNGGCYVDGTNATCTGPGDGIFTMLDSGGAVLQNTSYPYYGDTTWGYGKRTQMGGTLSVNVEDGVGSALIGGFDFYNGGAAIASNIKMKSASGSLWLSNMNFAWNGSNIVTQVVYDFAGLLAELPPSAGSIPALTTVFDSTTCTTSGVCATPASDGTKTTVAMGPAPVATSSFNVTGQVLPLNGDGTSNTTLADLSLGTDDSVGGSPMDNGPFVDFNANFDFGALKVSGYNDTTKPVLSLSATSASINAGDSFNVNNPPGITVTCADNADGNDNITDAVGNNDKISFAVSGTIDTGTPGVYPLTYTCLDSASSRAAILDPQDPALNTVPANNTSDSVADSSVLSVTVSSVGQPVITLLGTTPITHEACITYADAGATAVDGAGDPISPVIVDDINSIIGNQPAEGVATINYDINDSGQDAVRVTRTVNVVDTIDPVITLAAPIVLESTNPGGFVKPTASAADCSGIVGGTTISTADDINFAVSAGNDSVQTTLKYFATDLSAAGNQTQEDLIATVYRSEPVITLLGSASLVIPVNGAYTEPGMDIRDIQDGTLTGITTSGTTSGTEIVPNIVGVTGSGSLSHSIVIRDASNTIVPSVDTSIDGASYTISYVASDSDSNNAATVQRVVNIGAYAENANFTMLDPFGLLVDGAIDVVVTWDQESTTDVASTDFNMTIVSANPTPFKGFPWFAHHVRTFSEGSYQIDTTCTTTQLETGIAACNGYLPLTGPPTVQTESERFVTLNVGPGQIGAHMLFNWGATNPGSVCGLANCNIDVGIVWDQNEQWTDPDPSSAKTNTLYFGRPGEIGPAPDASWDLVSTDPDGDLINGIKMVDGPFRGFNANFNFNPDSTAESVAIVMDAPDTKLGSGSVGLAGLFTSLLTLLSFGTFRKRKIQ